MPRKIKVLLVKLSEDDASAVETNLKEDDYEPELARVETVESMRAALRERKWDAVISHFSLSNDFGALSALEVLKTEGFPISGDTGVVFDAIVFVFTPVCELVERCRFRTTPFRIEPDLPWTIQRCDRGGFSELRPRVIN